MAILTDTKAKNIKPNDKPLPHGGITGLTLHPSSKTKSKGKWVLRYVSPVTQKRRNAGLGTYPEIGIAEVAKQASSMREQISKGIDPLEEKFQEAQQTKIPTFEQAAHILHQERLPSWKNKKHGQQWINTLNQYAFPIIGAYSLDTLQPKHIADVLRPIWLDKAETAGRVKQRIHAVMAWAWANDYCQSNPVDVVSRLLPPQPSKTLRTQHQPAMPWQILPEFVQTHLCKDTTDVTRLALSFLILTATRSGEVRGMKWSEIDLDKKIWTIPAERMKAKLQHRIPLSKQAINILKQQIGRNEELVFPSPKKQTELSDMVFTSFLRRINATSDVENRVATAHGFRSSFRDWCSEQGYPRDLAERALAHTIQNTVEAAYHRTDLLEQRRGMMQAWGSFVAGRNL